MLNKGFCPLPNWFILQGFSLKLSNRERVLYFAMGIEIFQFPESRETMAKELSCRYLERKTGIFFTHIAKILKKFESMGLIKIQRSFSKDHGSLIELILPMAELTMDKSVTTTVSHGEKCVTAMVTSQKNPISKKDPSQILQEKGYTEEDIRKVIERINLSIQQKDIKFPVSYLIQSCRNEPVKIYSAPVRTFEKFKEEKKSAIEKLEEIKRSDPENLYLAVLEVDGDKNIQKSLKFFESEVVKGEILAAHYLKRYKENCRKEIILQN